MQKHSWQKDRLGWAAVVAIVAVPVACLNTTRVAAAPAAVVEDTWDTFSATVSIQQTLVNAAGTVVWTAPAVDMRMERWMGSAGWQTAITLEGVDKPVVRGRDGMETLENPFLAVRMEYDADGTAARFFNKRGQRVSPPSKTERKLLFVPPDQRPDMAVADLSGTSIVRGSRNAPRPAWMDNVIATPGMRSARRAALEQRYGVMRGRVNGLDQYVLATGDSTCEVLVNADAVVPIEMNVARSRQLVARSTYTHEARPDGVLVRRLLHAERGIAIGKDNRSVTDVALTNVALSKRSAK